MAPFKLKFRMGSSRSISQEHGSDPQVNEALLNHYSTVMGASNSTIDSADCNSLSSLSTNERKSLLPSKSNNLRLGYINHSAPQETNETATGSSTVPTTPPPLYEHVLEESTHLSNLNQRRKLSCEESLQRSQQGSSQTLQNSASLSRLETFSLSGLTPCTDPNCLENYANNEQHLQRAQQQNGELGADHNDSGGDKRKKSFDSTDLLISSNMTQPSSPEHLLEGCTEECQQYNNEEVTCDGACGGGNINDGNETPNSRNTNDFCDPLLNHSGYCSNESHYSEDYGGEHLGQQQQMEKCSDADGNVDWDTSGHYCHMQAQQEQQHLQSSTQDRSLTPEIISNKSSKEIYKDLAKQWGITCKMSDGCRCMECQGHYFDCDFDDNEHQKTDGGLGAGTPMFISEVMHGSACQIL